MKIGVFDSGIGGKAVAQSLEVAFPKAKVLYVHDQAHVPYGSREESEIIALTDAAIQPLLKDACDVIVIACNTATAAAIETLRAWYPDTPFVGLEPMVKPAAAATKSGVIAVCATPYTLSSARYQSLKQTYAQGVIVLEPDCSEWATMIEDDALNERQVRESIEAVCQQGADVIVLACTHYHWIKEDILEIAAGRAEVIDPSAAIAERVRELLG